jgi:hypothetical protein
MKKRLGMAPRLWISETGRLFIGSKTAYIPARRKPFTIARCAPAIVFGRRGRMVKKGTPITKATGRMTYDSIHGKAAEQHRKAAEHHPSPKPPAPAKPSKSPPKPPGHGSKK